MELFETYLFDEHFFSTDQALLVRKALAFIEIPDYDLHHFRRFLGATIPSKSVSFKAAERTFLQIQIALEMIYHYGAVEGGNHEVALRAQEIALLKTYRWMQRDDLFSNTRIFAHLTRTIDAYFAATIEFFAKIDPLLDVLHGLARTGLHEGVEYPLRVLKVGALAAQWMIFVARIHALGGATDELKAMGTYIGKFLLRLRDSCPPVERPLFDYQMSEVCLFAIALRVIGGEARAVNYLDSVISRLYLEATNGNPLPEGVGDFEAVARLVIQNKEVEWYSKSSSTLLPMLAEMCALLDAEPLHQMIRTMWQEKNKINFQNVYFNGRFVEWACGEGPPADDDQRNETSIILPPNMEDFRIEIDRKRSLDADFAALSSLPFFELISHIACRTHKLRLSPSMWRALRAPSAPEKSAETSVG